MNEMASEEDGFGCCGFEFEGAGGCLESADAFGGFRFHQRRPSEVVGHEVEQARPARRVQRARALDLDRGVRILHPQGRGRHTRVRMRGIADALVAVDVERGFEWAG